MEAIFWILLVAAVYVSYRVAKNKGYSGILFGILTPFFPILVIIVFLIPDKSAELRKAQIDRDFENSFVSDDNTKNKSTVNREEKSEATVQKSAATVAEIKRPTSSSSDQPRRTSTKREVTADLIAGYEHAVACYRDKQYFLALPHFIKMAETGHLLSQMYCAQIYYQGQGCDPDKKKALYWYEMAAEQGELLAQNNCSYMYKTGEGTSINMEKAFYWKKKAAEQGDSDSQYQLGMMYELGQGCNTDPDTAKIWYEKSAAQGNPTAKKLLEGI